MSALDMIQVIPVDADGEGKGVPVLKPLADAVEGATGFTQAAVVAAAAVPFADLTAAANKVNEILTSLKAAGLMASA